jgi:hypothetical protein
MVVMEEEMAAMVVMVMEEMEMAAVETMEEETAMEEMRVSTLLLNSI